MATETANWIDKVRGRNPREFNAKPSGDQGRKPSLTCSFQPLTSEWAKKPNDRRPETRGFPAFLFVGRDVRFGQPPRTGVGVGAARWRQSICCDVSRTGRHSRLLL